MENFEFPSVTAALKPDMTEPRTSCEIIVEFNFKENFTVRYKVAVINTKKKLYRVLKVYFSCSKK
jgi:hypothetical protein